MGWVTTTGGLSSPQDTYSFCHTQQLYLPTCYRTPADLHHSDKGFRIQPHTSHLAGVYKVFQHAASFIQSAEPVKKLGGLSIAHSTNFCVSASIFYFSLNELPVGRDDWAEHTPAMCALGLLHHGSDAFVYTWLLSAISIAVLIASLWSGGTSKDTWLGSCNNISGSSSRITLWCYFPIEQKLDHSSNV